MKIKGDATGKLYVEIEDLVSSKKVQKTLQDLRNSSIYKSIKKK